METVAIDRRRITITDGDLYLLCSDGLSDGGLETLLPLVLRGSIEAIADRLLDFSLEAGGNDNISLVLIGIGPKWNAGDGWPES